VSSDHDPEAGIGFETYQGFQLPGNGALIAFCGVDGSGKSTQLALLAERLRPTHPTFATRQPTSAFRRDPLVRAFIDGKLNGDDPAVAAEIGPEFALLAATDRYRHMRTEVMPRLRAGEVVLTDRYVYSCYAYCEARLMAPFGWMRQINRYIPYPDLTLFVDVPATVALERIRGRGDEPRWEELDERRVNAIRSAYQDQAWGEDPGYHHLDGTLPVADLAEQIAELADATLRAKGLPGIAPRPAAAPVVTSDT